MKLALKITPGARRNEFLGWASDPLAGRVMRLKIAAPPVEGRANRETLAFAARLLGLRPSEVALLRGASSRLKWIEVPEGTPLPEKPGQGA